MNFPFAAQRALFPILRQKVQLSSCSQSALSTPVAEALSTYTQSWLERGMDWIGWMETVSAAKAEFAKLIGADADEIAVMSSVSDIASSLASALDFSAARNRVVVAEIDFPSIGHVWLAQQKRGAEVVFAKKQDGNVVDQSTYATLIDERTRLVSVSHVSYYNGFIQDIAAIARESHRHGALLFVDAYQSAGALQIDVKRDGIDMLACGAQKFLLGCPGVAFLYVRRDLVSALEPLNTGWFGRVNPFSFDIRALDYAATARRFDTGTPPMINCYAVQAGLKLLNSLDGALVEQHLRFLSSVALEEAGALGLSIASPTDLKVKASNTAIHVPNASAVEAKMAEAGYIVSARNDVIRIAPHFYNTAEDVTGALRTLAQLLHG